MKQYIIPLVTTLALGLTACNTNNDSARNSAGGATEGSIAVANPDQDQTTTGGSVSGVTLTGELATSDSRWGFVQLANSDEVEILASFGQSSEDFSPEQLIKALMPEQDTCTVYTEDPAIIDTGEDILELLYSVNYLSAGDTITFTSPAGTYATLLQKGIAGTVYYVPDTNGSPVLGPLPSGMTMDISGGEFPAFATVTVPDAPPLQFYSPKQSETITPNTTFSWAAHRELNSFIDISMSGFNTATGRELSVECVVRDDGFFSFPAQFRAKMGAGFSAQNADLARTVYQLEKSGNALLFVSNFTSY